VQDKVWVDDPDGAPWEIYTVLAHAETSSGEAHDTCGAGSCTTDALPADDGVTTVQGCC
jgi:hypothetical protein